MIDWAIVARVAGGGYGATIFVLVSLWLAAWIMGIIVQKTAKKMPESKQSQEKG